MLAVIFVILTAATGMISMASGACPSEINYLNYDSQRDSLAQVLDGLTLQFRLARSDEVGFIFERNPDILMAVGSLVDLIILQKETTEEDFMSVEIAEMTNVVFDQFSADACVYLSQMFSGWYKSFNCTKEQLEHISTIIKLYNLIFEVRNNLLSPVFFGSEFCASSRFECAYWNSHVLGNCTAYNSSTIGDAEFPRESLALVQTNILQPILRFCAGSAGFCPVN